MASAETLLLSYLVNALWQVPALVAGAAMAGLALRRAPARHRHTLWSATVLLVAALPIGQALLGTPRRETRTASSATTSSVSAQPAGYVSGASAAAIANRGGRELDGDEVVDDSKRLLAADLTLSRESARLLVGLWGLALVLQSMRLLRAAIRTRTLRRSSEAVALDDLVAPSARRVVAAGVALRRTEAAIGPLTFGVRTPIILLPAELLDECRPEELETVLAHELAHVARRDCLRQWLFELLLAPVAAHPAVWILRRRLASTREMACDEAAAEVTGRHQYARALLGLAHRIAGLSAPATTLGVFDANILEERMRRLTNGPAPIDSHRSRWISRALVAALAASAGLLAAASWSVAASRPAEAATLLASSPPPSAALAPFAGHWHGDYSEGEGNGLPGAALLVGREADGGPRVVLLMYRYLRTEAGGITSSAAGAPVADLRIESGALRFRTREERWRFHGGPETPVDFEWRFSVAADGSGELALLSNSYFLPAKARGEKVPPPPPPIRMRHTYSGDAELI